MDVTDGDTFDVRRSIGGTVTIRLHGVDAPESAQSYGTAATQAARRYVDGKSVRVAVEEIGRYGRAVARTEVQGADLGPMLIAAGWRGITASMPRTPPNMPAYNARRETPAAACGHRRT
nr:thermonuclease family protein [Salinibacter ruber]